MRYGMSGSLPSIAAKCFAGEVQTQASQIRMQTGIHRR